VWPRSSESRHPLDALELIAQRERPPAAWASPPRPSPARVRSSKRASSRCSAWTLCSKDRAPGSSAVSTCGPPVPSAQRSRSRRALRAHASPNSEISDIVANITARPNR
jgi:hypothetical protein